MSRAGRRVRAGRRLAAAGALALAGCAAAEPAPPPPRAAPPSRPRAEAPGPARYLADRDRGWIERTEDGVDRLVLEGRRVELRGLEVAAVGEAEPAVAGGAASPPWSAAMRSTVGLQAAPHPVAVQAPARYVFWNTKKVYAAEAFDGPLRALATLPGDVRGAFDWLDGVGLVTAAGVFVVRAADGVVAPLGVPGVVAALAANARRAVVLTVFGRALLTLDGGGSYRDATAELGEPARAEVRGEDLAVLLRGGRARLIGPDGVIRAAPRSVSARRGPPPDVDPRWPRRAAAGPLEAAVASGVPLADGGAAVASGGFVGRVDLGTGLATSAAELPEGAGACAPFQAPDALLAVCAGSERATVVDLTGAPRIERTFDLPPGPQARDRFVGTDVGGLGYIGPCTGAPRPAPDVDAIARASSRNPSPQQSAVFCVRRAAGDWVERRLDPADATDVVAWIPRPGGGAVALVARPGPFFFDGAASGPTPRRPSGALRGEARVEARGALRVVRLSRGEPPLSLPEHRYGSPVLLSRALVVHPDDAVEGWLPAQSGGVSFVPVVLGPDGVIRRRALPPRVNLVLPSGRFALAQTEDGKLFESVDWGARWLEVAPPPGDPPARPATCSAVGCRVGPFFRIGWASAASRPPPPPADEAAIARAARKLRAYRRPPPAPPLVRLDCAFSGPAEGRRVPDSYGFGVTASPVPRGSGAARLGAIGAMILPWSGTQPAAGADAELSWIAPLDVGGRIRRATIPLQRASLGNLAYRPYEAKLGYVIDGQGRVSPVAVGVKEACLAGLLDAAGVTRPIGGCAPEPSVGVDLGGRVVLLSPRYSSHTISAVALPEGAGGAAPLQRQLRVHHVAPGANAFTFGAGLRAGAPVVVAVGVAGAVLAPMDPERGDLGPEERLAPLTALRAGDDAACAPRPNDARVVLAFDTEIGLSPASLPGVVPSGAAGVAVVRWSRDRACLDAVELGVRDERYEMDLGYYDPAGTVKKLIARFTGPPARDAALVLVTYGQEVRQPLACKGIAK